MGRKTSPNDTFFNTELNCFVLRCKHADFLFDVKDLQKVNKYHWFSKSAQSTGQYYAYAHFKGNKKILLHRYLLNVNDKNLVDHINRNTLDNRRINLRIVTKRQNNLNTKKRKNCRSIYKGVTLRPSGRWGVYIKTTLTNLCLGTYDTEEQAALAYNKKALEIFKEYANINIIKKGDK